MNGPAATVWAWVPDLMDRSRLGGLAGIAFVADPSELPDKAGADDVVLVDLSRPPALAAISELRSGPAARQPKAIVGFSGHLERDLMRRASEAGCDRVMARSAFFKQAASVLASLASAKGEAPGPH